MDEVCANSILYCCLIFDWVFDCDRHQIHPRVSGCSRSAKQKTKELNNARAVAEAISMLHLQDNCVNSLCEKRHLTPLEVIMKQIVINMKEYVKFLPRVMLSSLDTRDDDSDVGSATESSCSGSHYSKSHSIHSRETQKSAHQRVRKNLSTGLRNKQISILTMDISDTHEILRDCSDTSRFVEVHADFVDSMIELVKSSGGRSHCRQDQLVEFIGQSGAIVHCARSRFTRYTAS
mmetsp:Transcript_5728/g.21703  ORF Transcript_5728/g.21703 Transcript_5728/m.21703 type:complete len:234 (+) Transcript_5728:6502-7203(+)